MNKAIAIILLLLIAFGPCCNLVFACPTCGCNELCPIAMFADETQPPPPDSLLSNSIWGNLILRIAYAQDPELQRLSKHRNRVNLGSAAAIGAAGAGILPQSVVSIYTLNPPDGVEDSYAPGTVGVALEGITNLALVARIGLNYRINKKVRARQAAIRRNIETVLEHLECSATNCPDAQKQLAQYIGDKAAAECIDLWQSSHGVASVPDAPTVSENTPPASFAEQSIQAALSARQVSQNSN